MKRLWVSTPHTIENSCINFATPISNLTTNNLLLTGSLIDNINF